MDKLYVGAFGCARGSTMLVPYGCCGIVSLKSCGVEEQTDAFYTA